MWGVTHRSRNDSNTIALPGPTPSMDDSSAKLGKLMYRTQPAGNSAGRDLLEAYIGCCLSNSTTALSRLKDRGSGSCVLHEPGCPSSPNLVLESQGIPKSCLQSMLEFWRSWNPEEVGSNSSEGMDLPTGLTANSQNPNAFFFSVLLCRLPPESMAQIYNGSSHLR